MSNEFTGKNDHLDGLAEPDALRLTPDCDPMTLDCHIPFVMDQHLKVHRRPMLPLRIYSIRAALMRTAKYQLLHFFLHNRSLANPTVSDVIVGCSKSTKIRVRYIVALPDFFLLSRGFLWFEPSQRTEDSCPAVAGGLAHVFNRRL